MVHVFRLGSYTSTGSDSRPPINTTFPLTIEAHKVRRGTASRLPLKTKGTHFPSNEEIRFAFGDGSAVSSLLIMHGASESLQEGCEFDGFNIPDGKQLILSKADLRKHTKPLHVPHSARLQAV